MERAVSCGFHTCALLSLSLSSSLAPSLCQYRHDFRGASSIGSARVTRQRVRCLSGLTPVVALQKPPSRRESITRLLGGVVLVLVCPRRLAQVVSSRDPYEEMAGISSSILAALATVMIRICRGRAAAISIVSAHELGG